MHACVRFYYYGSINLRTMVMSTINTSHRASVKNIVTAKNITRSTFVPVLFDDSVVHQTGGSFDVNKRPN